MNIAITVSKSKWHSLKSAEYLFSYELFSSKWEVEEVSDYSFLN